MSLNDELPSEINNRECSGRNQHSIKHGHTRGYKRSPEYRAWAHLKGRCLNKNDPRYPVYGERGITIYKPWIDSFEAFLAEVGPRPSSEYTLDRIDNDRGYEPGNVRWATRKRQARNQQRSIFIEWKGKKTTLIDACEEEGLPYLAVYLRIYRRHWGLNEALSTPLRAS